MKGKYYKLKESLSFCIFIQIGMLPLIIYFQYEAPAFSFLANVAAVPLATCAFTLAFLLIFLPYTVFHEAISWMIQGVLWISRQSYGMLTIGHVPFLWVTLILFYDRIVDMEEKWTKSTYQDQSGLCYHDHFDMDSNGKKKKSGIS